jgi:hypothetical protein
MRIAAKSVQKMRLDGVASRGPASDVTARYSADGFAVKVNGTAVIKHKGKYSIWEREYS